jgi:hypothetical protein
VLFNFGFKQCLKPARKLCSKAVMKQSIARSGRPRRRCFCPPQKCPCVRETERYQRRRHRRCRLYSANRKLEAISATTSLPDGDRTFMPKFNYASPFLVPVNNEKAPKMFRDVPDRLSAPAAPLRSPSPGESPAPEISANKPLFFKCRKRLSQSRRRHTTRLQY